MAASDDVIVYPHLRMTWGGVLGSPALEIWSNTINWAWPADNVGGQPQAAPSEAQLLAGAQAVKEALAGWFQSAQAAIGGSAWLSWIKLNAIDDHGLQRAGNTVVVDYQQPVAGVSPVNPIWEQTYAITLRTALQRGRSHSGRIYPPLSGTIIGAGQPYLDVDHATQMATGFKNLLNALNQGMNGAFLAAGYDPSGYFPTVISAGSRSAAKPEKHSIITGVVVDRVADIQHRRTNRVPRAESPLISLNA